MNNELEGIWQCHLLVQRLSRGAREKHQNLSQQSPFPDPDLNPESPYDEAEIQCSVM
jgi:hypothetical protein